MKVLSTCIIPVFFYSQAFHQVNQESGFRYLSARRQKIIVQVGRFLQPISPENVTAIPLRFRVCLLD